MPAPSGYVEIPVDVIVKFSQDGHCIPVKLVYCDEMYVIDRAVEEYPYNPRRITNYAPRIFSCSIEGQRRALYYYVLEGRWCIKKFMGSRPIGEFE